MPRTQIDRVDGLTTSLACKPACTCATTAAITLSGLQTIDGVTVVGDDIYPPDRVLVKDQADAATNGIYNPSINAWTRALDFDGQRDITDGSLVWVRGGDTNAGLWKAVCADRTVVIDTSEITFEPIVLFGGLVTRYFGLPIFIEGTPTASEEYPVFLPPFPCSLPAGLDDGIYPSRFRIRTLPTATLTATILKNQVSIGTVAFSTGGVPTVTFASTVTLDHTVDDISLSFPASPDATGAGIAFMLVFNLT